MSFIANAPPKWEAKTRPKTAVREYGIEVSAETFQKLYWLVKGKNAANQDSPDKLRVSDQAETILRLWLTEHYPDLDEFWSARENNEKDAIDHVAAQQGNVN